MSKQFRNYTGLTTSSQFDLRSNAKGMANMFDLNLGFTLDSVTGGQQDGIQPGNGYVYHVFTAPGFLVVNCPPGGVAPVDVLVVGGGGGGGTGWYGGGGGGGGVIYYPNYTLKKGPHSVTVGAGGAPSTNGGDSTYGQPDNPLVALGGGYGGPRSAPGGPGGSGGGVGLPNAFGEGIQTTDLTIPANSRTYGHGNDGGPQAYGAGGGGASQAGFPGPQGGGGDGYDAGLTFDGPVIGYPGLNPQNGFFGGGGAGGAYPGGSQPGGAGGGAGVGNQGVDITGGGGGGGQNNGAAGGSGGSGVVIFRYPDSLLPT